MRIFVNIYTTILLLLSIITLLMLDAYDVELFHGAPLSPDKLGTIGDWVSGLLTAIAVLIAAAEFRSEQRAAIRDERDQRERERRAEARELEERLDRQRLFVGRVYCWIEYKFDPVSKMPAGALLEVNNQTDTPVYEWRAHIEGYELVQVCSEVYGPIVPGQKSIVIQDTELLDGGLSKKVPRVSIEFDAVNGEHFKRAFSGQLNIVHSQGGIINEVEVGSLS